MVRARRAGRDPRFWAVVVGTVLALGLVATGCGLTSGGSSPTTTVAASGRKPARTSPTTTKPATTTSKPAPSTTKPAPSTTKSTTTTVPGAPAPLFKDGFAGSDGLVTNEYAFWNPSAPDAVTSSGWELTSGSLFRSTQQGWTGSIDDVEPDARSTTGTDSAIFRLTTRAANFGDVNVQLELVNRALTSTGSTPPVDWDGVHIFLRYQSETNLYYASVNRRDGRVVIKKKCTGGTENGGTYYELATSTGTTELPGHPIPFGAVQHVGATVVNQPDGSVVLALQREGSTLLSVRDTGVGCDPIRTPGKVGLRGDNDDFRFDDFTVTPA
jgi:hypothetical protein